MKRGAKDGSHVDYLCQVVQPKKRQEQSPGAGVCLVQGTAGSQCSWSGALGNECAGRSERSRGPPHVGLWLLLRPEFSSLMRSWHFWGHSHDSV